jgi:hypothetical protein
MKLYLIRTSRGENSVQWLLLAWGLFRACASCTVHCTEMKRYILFDVTETGLLNWAWECLLLYVYDGIPEFQIMLASVCLCLYMQHCPLCTLCTRCYKPARKQCVTHYIKVTERVGVMLNTLCQWLMQEVKQRQIRVPKPKDDGSAPIIVPALITTNKKVHCYYLHNFWLCSVVDSVSWQLLTL